ncbi:MAG TPA: cupin domain-containing protein [Candidatus Nitrosotalea sp.]|nr:cupin domain-containing protein [Candidatus Nitrosotalea sp.]
MRAMPVSYNAACSASRHSARCSGWWVPHPIEGGHFVETYRSAERLPAGRAVSTAIYYLLTPDTFSAMRPPTAPPSSPPTLPPPPHHHPHPPIQRGEEVNKRGGGGACLLGVRAGRS